MAIVYIGIGTNLGDRNKNITVALQFLENDPAITNIHCSSIIETKPVGGPEQDDYLNAVARLETQLSPEDCLRHLQTVEQTMGRIRTVTNGPRVIDLDILLYDDIIHKSHGLRIPHPRMWDRDFVVQPLKEIAPDVVKRYTHANH